MHYSKTDFKLTCKNILYQIKEHILNLGVGEDKLTRVKRVWVKCAMYRSRDIQWMNILYLSSSISSNCFQNLVIRTIHHIHKRKIK